MGKEGPSGRRGIYFKPFLINFLCSVRLHVLFLLQKYYVRILCIWNLYAASEGEKVTAGQKLMHFDMAKIREKGYSTTTAVLLTNSDDYPGFHVLKTGKTEQLRLYTLHISCKIINIKHHAEHIVLFIPIRLFFPD